MAPGVAFDWDGVDAGAAGAAETGWSRLAVAVGMNASPSAQQMTAIAVVRRRRRRLGVGCLPVTLTIDQRTPFQPVSAARPRVSSSAWSNDG